MSTILAVETSTLTASIAIVRGEDLLIERESTVNNHSELLLPLIDECLLACELELGDLNTIAVGAGPGSFTGLRIGMATVKGLCFARGIPMTLISSLLALAEDCRPHSEPDTLIVPILDARRKEVFAGVYRHTHGVLESLSAERVLAPEDLPEQLRSFHDQPLVLCGDGAHKYRSVFAGIGPISESRQTPSAAAIAKLAQNASCADVLTAAPTYVRLPEAQIKFPNGNPGGTFGATPKSADK